MSWTLCPPPSNREIGFVSFVRAMRSCVWARGGENSVAGVSRCKECARRPFRRIGPDFPPGVFADRCWGFKRIEVFLLTGDGVLRDSR